MRSGSGGSGEAAADENPALANALAFAAMGSPVLPVFGVVEGEDGLVCACGDADCSSPGKHPLNGGGLKNASTDPGQIEAWAAQWPGCNFGVRCDGMLVVDVDGDAGGAALRRLEKAHGPLPLTWRVSTGRQGGRHYYFGLPEDIDGTGTARAGKLAKAVDIRAGSGCYVIVPGSRHIVGHRYQWFKRGHPNNTRMATVPDWVMTLVGESSGSGALGFKPAKPIDEWRDLAGADISSGERNCTLAKLTGHLLHAMLDPLVVHELVQSHNRAHCKPPLSVKEVERLFLSIASRDSDRRRVNG